MIPSLIRLANFGMSRHENVRFWFFGHTTSGADWIEMTTRQASPGTIQLYDCELLYLTHSSICFEVAKNFVLVNYTSKSTAAGSCTGYILFTYRNQYFTAPVSYYAYSNGTSSATWRIHCYISGAHRNSENRAWFYVENDIR